MFLYNLTLQRATAITHAVHGNFSGTKTQEIAISRGKSLELLRPDSNTGKVHTLLTIEIFGIIRSLMAFRLTGGTKDYVVVGSDSGRIVILEYIAAKNIFEKVHQETFGKSGTRRIVPGQYLATDPRGRAVMVGAIEKQKLAYILNRDAQARLTISSPLEAHKSNTLVYHMVGVDVGYDNPIFACLEIDYEEADSDPTGEAAQKTQQTLTFYELDLGLNHVVRKYSEPLEEHANFLVTVPGGDDGPSGVLICSENYLTYKNLGDQHDIRCPIPRRRNDLDDPERGMIFVCSATHKTKSMFFFLAQTEQGDIFKITLETDEDMVTEIKLKYFDTVPVATAMCVLKTGFLFVASEFGNHYLYQIAHLGDDDDELEFSSAMPLEEGDTFFFAPRPLRNLVLVDELESLSPILSSRVADLAGEDTPQLYMMCGRGPRSSLRVLRHGLEVSEMAVSELPGNPNAVWTVKRRSDDEYDAYIIVSFINATLVLSIGETVEEVTDSGFLGTTPTLSCSALSDDALVQVYPDGIRHICADKRVNEWKAGKKYIVKCAVNQRQVVIALSGGELVYFEMDPHIPNAIVNIQAMGKRIFVSDVQESVFMVRYKRNENQLIIFADDTHPRWITCKTVLDYDTVATADKFGNIAILRLPPNVSDDVEEDPTGHKALWDRGLLNGASQKADTISTFHVGETVTWLQKATLIPGGSESLIYTTLSGTVGVLVPFTSHEDHDFFQHLEMQMRSENPPLCGRDHLSFRCYYFPVKNVIDGDMCEQYNSLEPAKQKSIATDLDRTPAEVSKKLEDIRTRYAF
ncbi:splicing factor 3B subunit 3 isoform X2 [Anoplophora glabripennis]|uniref:splicing factor 3B subunit 3 isoform X2 n=1 Tax=Anoplophora glabripennis TaxID=217634 RepID=UPI000874240D|nr:splicing factor 3B subunit 3 isoform X2 [Anoplophora glabripennis]